MPSCQLLKIGIGALALGCTGATAPALPLQDAMKPSDPAAFLKMFRDICIDAGKSAQVISAAAKGWKSDPILKASGVNGWVRVGGTPYLVTFDKQRGVGACIVTTALPGEITLDAISALAASAWPGVTPERVDGKSRLKWRSVTPDARVVVFDLHPGTPARTAIFMAFDGETE